MEKIKSRATIEAKIILELSEGEARALDAIVGYGPDVFVKWFYKNCGQHYLKPHELAMRSLFDYIRKELGPHLSRVDKARDVFTGKAEAKTIYPNNFQPQSK